MGFLPCGLHGAEPHGPVPVPTCTDRFVTRRAPGASGRPAPGVIPRVHGHRLELEALAAERRPGPGGGGAAADAAVDGDGRVLPPDPCVLGLDLRGERHAFDRLWLCHQVSRLEAVERGDEQSGTCRSEPVEQVAGGVGRGRMVSVITP